MRNRIAILALALLVGLPVLAAAAATTWEVDPVHSTVGFSVRHFLTRVPGQFNEFSGTIVYDPDDLSSSSVELTVQAASIDTDNERRDGHLKSPDFFAVEEHPTLSFKSKKVAGVGDGDLAVTGDLTIRGVTTEVTVPVDVLGTMGEKAGFSTEFKVDRSDYNVSWNRAVEGGGTILGDEVRIRIDVEANMANEGGGESAE